MSTRAAQTPAETKLHFCPPQRPLVASLDLPTSLAGQLPGHSDLKTRAFLPARQSAEIQGAYVSTQLAARRRRPQGITIRGSVAHGEPAMSLEPLVLDLIEWIAKEPRTYAEVMEAWRTSCPKLAVWEEAIDRGFVERPAVGGRGFVLVTKRGEDFLRANRRTPG